jgi:hypothetical protein
MVNPANDFVYLRHEVRAGGELRGRLARSWLQLATWKKYTRYGSGILLGLFLDFTFEMIIELKVVVLDVAFNYFERYNELFSRPSNRTVTQHVHHLVGDGEPSGSGTH